MVIEAGAMGLPSIVTDINGSREIIQDGVNGLIVPSKNEDALLKEMERLVDDSALASYLGSWQADTSKATSSNASSTFIAR